MSERSTLHALAAVLPLTAAAAQSTSLEANAALLAAQTAAQRELRAPALRLAAQNARVSGAWAFVLAEMRSDDGRPFDFDGTPLAEAAREGYVSRECAALLARRDGRWEVVELRIGPTDAPWEGWAAKHHAPPALFRLP